MIALLAIVFTILFSPAAGAFSFGVYCNVLVTSGGSISTGFTNTPTNGTLCVNSGSYGQAGTTLTVNKTLTIQGVPWVNPTLVASNPFIPSLTQTSQVTMISVSANSVVIRGLKLTGNGTPPTNNGACSYLAIDVLGTTSDVVIDQNEFANWECGPTGETSTTRPAFTNNYAHGNTYGAFGCTGCVGAAGQTAWSGNVVYDENTAGTAGNNAYPFTITGTSSHNSSNFTIQNNWVINSVTWSCMDAHGGVNLLYLSNTLIYCNGGAGSVGFLNGGSDTSTSPTNPSTGNHYNNNILDNGTFGTTNTTDSAVLCGDTCSVNTNISGGQVENNTMRFGASNSTGGIATSPNVTVSGNTGSLDPEVVSSITLGSWTDGTANQFIHGQPNHSIAVITVNMSAASWNFPGPGAAAGTPAVPGLLSIGGANSCGLQVVGNQLVQKATGGSPASTCNDFSIIVTLHGMSGSPFTQASGTLTVTGT